MHQKGTAAKQSKEGSCQFISVPMDFMIAILEQFESVSQSLKAIDKSVSILVTAADRQNPISTCAVAVASLKEVQSVRAEDVPEQLSTESVTQINNNCIEVKSWKDISLAEGEYLMTINIVLSLMNVVRATLFNLREDGLIRSYKKGRSVRFRSSDIEDAICWYSIPKGKI